MDSPDKGYRRIRDELERYHGDYEEKSVNKIFYDKNGDRFKFCVNSKN